MKNNKQETNKITGIILAGGRAKRMDGQDKGLIQLMGRPMISHIIEQLSPQLDNIIINANRNIDEYSKFSYQVISDQNSSNFHGPLAGMLSGMRACDTEYILSVPCDTPFLPADLCSRLLNKLLENNADICVVHDGKRLQPVFALINTKLQESLQDYLDSGDRKIDLWYQQHQMITADFSDYKNISMNINTPDDLKSLEQLLTEKKKAC